ncbi:MAG TPA: sigma-70 family RNA polymerase sigma factor [Blastocatellia bacterium]|nr:sigma-70 family RNA polymerase sigma factor [Blastocatellia bacterium]
MTDDSSNQVTQLLVDWGNGDKDALDKLVPIVYQELRKLARHYMRGERAGHTLETTALVNEAYLRLVDYNRMQWQNRAHFFAVSAQVMRRILIDHARSHLYQKRGGGAIKVSLSNAAGLTEQRASELVAVDTALEQLAAMDPRKSRIVELRFFGGLSVEETAEVLGISTPTVQREWRKARAWLHKTIDEGK